MAGCLVYETQQRERGEKNKDRKQKTQQFTKEKQSTTWWHDVGK